MSSGHPDRCGCAFCAELKAKTMPLSQWTAMHEPHLQRRGGEEFESEPFNHPAGGWHWIVCPCGAKFLTTGDVE
jgi:hypothetical protein